MKRNNSKPIKSKQGESSQTIKSQSSVEKSKCEQVADEMVLTISSHTGSLKDYPIRDLVKHSEELGKRLVEQDVKTNQLRKFLDAINQLKVELSLEDKPNIEEIEVSLQMLKPKLAYAVGRANKKETPGIKALKDVVSAAVDKIIEVKNVKSQNNMEIFRQDFQRLVNLIEAIIAYHKAAGGKNQ